MATTFTIPEDVTSQLNFVNGKRTVPADPIGKFNLVEPSSGKLLAEVPSSGPKDVDAAVAAASQAFPIWSSLTGLERGKILQRAGEIIRANIDALAHLETKDNGKPIYEAKFDMEATADTFTYYGGLAASLVGEHIPCASGNFAYTRREPLGVVGGIGAWNYPSMTCSWKVAPALACGNTMIYKPSPFALITPVIMAEIITAAGAPPGTINMIQGEGPTGESLCLHDKIAKISFTGSVPTGQRIMQLCGTKRLRSVTLELGGKSPVVIFEDAKMENAVSGAMLANFLNQGEVCSNGTRVFVHRKILAEFTEKVVERVKKLKIGDPFEEDTRVGAVINQGHMERILNYIQSARDEGAKILVGGERVRPAGDRIKEGFYVAPTVIADVNDNMRVVREEIFGPVMVILPFDSEEEVVKRANNTSYGLAAGIFTQNLQTAHRVAAQLQAGFVWINNYNVNPVEIPFGGYKQSGFGRELGLPAMHHYTQVKSVHVELGDIDSPI